MLDLESGNLVAGKEAAEEAGARASPAFYYPAPFFPPWAPQGRTGHHLVTKSFGGSPTGPLPCTLHRSSLILLP